MVYPLIFLNFQNFSCGGGESPWKTHFNTLWQILCVFSVWKNEHPNFPFPSEAFKNLSEYGIRHLHSNNQIQKHPYRFQFDLTNLKNHHRHLIIFTGSFRRNGEVNVLTRVCLCPHLWIEGGGGYPFSLGWGGRGVTTISGQGYPIQPWMGVPPVRLDGVTPSWDEVHRPLLRQSTVSTCYAVGGMSLVFTHEDFLVTWWR